MTDWDMVFEIFLSGIIGVFLVMALLLLCTMLSSAIVRSFENRGKKVETEAQKS